MSITAIATTMTKHLEFIFLVGGPDFCLFTLSKFNRFYKSDICSVRKDVSENNKLTDKKLLTNITAKISN
jgi:hypothetical protein